MTLSGWRFPAGGAAHPGTAMNASMPSLSRFARHVGALLLCAFVWPVAAAPGAPLAVCLAEDSLPFSSSQPVPAGVDYDVAVELARSLERPLQLSWVQIPSRGGLPKALHQSLDAGSCELFLGVPGNGDPDESGDDATLRTSSPYRSAAYVLVAARNSKVRTLADAQRARRIGAVTATPADLYLFRAGFSRVPYGSNAALLEALSTDAVDAAVMWMPALARLSVGDQALWPDAIRAQALDVPELRTSFSYVMRADRVDDAAAIDQLLRSMHADGALDRISQRYGLPVDS